MPKKRTRARRDLQKLLPVIFYYSIETIRAHEGTVPGIRFAKMAIHIHRELIKAGYSIKMPRRWYLYGEVPEVWDTSSVNDVEIINPEDELRSNVRWVGRPPRMSGDDLEYEIRDIAKGFEDRFGDESFLPEMLREHYATAPLDFQKAMLDFWLMIRSIMNYQLADNQEQFLKMIGKLVGTYNNEVKTIEPRLEPIFQKLMFLEKIRLSTRQVGDIPELLSIHNDIWEFWRKFCLVLSIRQNTDVSPARLDQYRTRAERELVPYLSAMPEIISQKFERLSQNHAVDTMLASEHILSKEWSSEEEVRAWANL